MGDKNPKKLLKKKKAVEKVSVLPTVDVEAVVAKKPKKK